MTQAGPLRRWTLTRRVVWAVTATVALLVGVQSVLAYVAMHAQEDDLTNELLKREVRGLVTLTQREGLLPTGALDASPRVSAYLSRPGEPGVPLPPYLQSLVPGLYQFSPGQQTLHVAVVDTEDGRLTVVLDATENESRVIRFSATLFAAWLFCIAVTAFIARGVAALAVGPIVEASRIIARWAPAAPPGHDRATGDEAALLMETFNRFRDGADEAIAHERAFAANLDHEIRTPLTTIRTDAELIGLDGLAPAQQARIDRIIAGVDEIIATTESTLSASAGQAAAVEAVDVREVVDTACHSLADRAALSGLRVEVSVPAGELLQAERQALLTVCRNIVRNAIDHAAPARLAIEGNAHALRFVDDGPGIEHGALPHVFERYFRGRRDDTAEAATAHEGRGASGRGLGLAIARRVCDLRGWRLSVRSPGAAGRGTTFILDFDVAA